MYTLKQGKKSVADFSVDFWILAEETGWKENALRGAFLNYLNDNIKRELATKELPKTLSALINMCIRLDDHMREFGKRSGEGRRAMGGFGTPTDLPPLEWWNPEEEMSEEGEAPMQLGWTRFGSSNRKRDQRGGECFKCGKKGHFADKCYTPVKQSARQ